MSTATLEDAEVQVSRDADTVAADLSVTTRHLRRKCQVVWDPFDEDKGEFTGTMIVGPKTWLVDLSYRKKYDCYRFRFYIPEDHSNSVARRFDVTAKNAYTLVNDTIAVTSTLRLIQRLDLEQD